MNKHLLPSFVLLGILFVLSACARGTRADFVPVGESAYTFTLLHEKLTARGTVTVCGQGQCEICFSSPETLRYLCYEADGDSVVVHFGSRAENVLLSDLPERSALRLTFLALDTFLFGTDVFRCSDGETVLAQAEILGTGVLASFSRDGYLKRLDFSDFSVLFDHG